MSAARVGGHSKRMRPGAIPSESKPGGITAAPLADAMSASSLSRLTMAGMTMPGVTTPAVTAVPAARAAGPVAVSALGRSATAGGSAADRAVTALYETQYRSLVRLAVLLVGDLRAAEDVVQESFAAMHQAWRRLRSQDAAVPFLHRTVVTRSRAIAPPPALAVPPRYEPPAAGPARRPLPTVPLGGGELASAPGPTSPTSPTGPGGTAQAPGAGAATGVIAALQQLPVLQREALALRLYLDLPDDRIAAAMQVSQASARQHVAGALAALRGVG